MKWFLVGGGLGRLMVLTEAAAEHVENNFDSKPTEHQLVSHRVHRRLIIEESHPYHLTVSGMESDAVSLK